MTMCKHCKPQSLSDCCKRLDLPLDAYELVSAKARKFLVILLSSRLSWNPPWSLCCHAKDEENCIIHLHLKKKMNGLGSAEIRRMGVLKSRWILFFELQYYAITCQPHLFPSILGLFPDQTTTSQWQKETSSESSRSEKKSKRQKVQHANMHIIRISVNVYTLQGIHISHLGKRKIIFKMPFFGDRLVPWRVNIHTYYITCGSISVVFRCC